MSFPIELARIREVEQTLGRQLPDGYVAHMQRANGGNTPDDRWILHPFFDATDRARIKRTAQHVLSETEQAGRLKAFPQGALVIGEDMEGTLLILLPSSSASDRFEAAVYAWHPFHGEVTKVVEDFTEFASGGDVG